MKTLFATAILALALSSTARAEGPPLARDATVPSGRAAPPVAADAGTMAAALDAAVLSAANSQRARVGLPPLAPDPVLAAAAVRYSGLMRDGGFFGHVSPTGEGLDRRLPGEEGWRYEHLGENLWSATGATGWSVPRIAGEVAANWIDSPSHRDNLLDPGFSLGGVGTVVRGDSIWVTMLYGRPHGDPAQAALLHRHGTAPADLGALAVSIRAEALRRVNRERRAAGLSALADGPVLTQVAQDHARAMLASGTLDSAGVLRRALARRGGVRQLALGVWQGSGTLVWRADALVDAMLDTWRQRPSNLADMLNPRFNRAGLGVATDGAQVFIAAIYAEDAQNPGAGTR